MLAKQYASHNRLKTEKKNEKLQKIKKNSANFRHFFVIFLNNKKWFLPIKLLPNVIINLLK